MAAQYVAIKRISSLDTPITAEKLDGSLFTTENQAHEFIVSVRKNGVKQIVTGSVSGKFIRANGTTIFLQGSIVDGDAVVRLHQDCYNVQGRFIFNIFNTQSGVTTCIYSAVGKMDMGSTETVIDAGDVVPDISDVVAKQEEMTQVIADARTATSAANTAAQNVGSIVARPYSSSSTYTAGDYCTNNGNLYKANQDISTAEEWTASHWTQIVMGDEVTDLKSAFNLLKTDMNAVFESGKWLVNSSTNRITASDSTTQTRAKVEIHGGCTYRVTFTSYGTSTYVLVFTDEFGISISNVMGEAAYTNKVVDIIAPTGATYLYVTHNIYPQTAVVPKVELVTSSAYSDAIIMPYKKMLEYMGGGIVKTDIVESTNYNGNISSSGVIQKQTNTNHVLYIYPVSEGKTYNLYGEGVRISSTNPIASFSTSLFNGTDSINSELVLVANTSNVATDYNYLFAPQYDGYVYVATYGTYPQLKVYEAEYQSAKINEVIEMVDDANKAINNVGSTAMRTPYDFGLTSVFNDLESTYIDDFTNRESMIDADHPYTVSGGTQTLPTITTGVGATRTGASGVSALYYSKPFTKFPYVCLFGRITGHAQLIRLYGTEVVSIGMTGVISYNGVTYGSIHNNTKYHVWYLTPDNIIIIDDSGVSVYVPLTYAQSKPMTIELGFGANNDRPFGYGSFVEFTKMPLTPLLFERCVAYNRLNEPLSAIKAAVRFSHSTWSNGAVNQFYYVPEDNPWMSLVAGISNNPCIKCTLDYENDTGYRTEIGVTPIRNGSLNNALGGLQRICASADYYMDSETNDMSESYQTYIFQIHNSNFTLEGWADAPPLSIRINNRKLVAAVAYIDDGAVPESDNRHTTIEYDIGDFVMDEWIHLEVQARIGWRDVLAPQLIIKINGQERLNLQTPVGFNIVSSGGYVNTHFGLYCPQWHDTSYTHMHREILVTNIRWSGTQKEN